MVAVKFPDTDTQDRAVGFLAGSFSGHVLRSGEVIIPEAALVALADQNFTFTVLGKATYDPSTCVGIEPTISEEELQQRERAGGGRTFAAILADLEARR